MAKPDLIPEMSAQDEKDEEHHWRSVVIMGLERKIDLKVIEPYKKVIVTRWKHRTVDLFIPTIDSRYYHTVVTKATIARQLSSYSAHVSYPIEVVSIMITSWSIYSCKVSSNHISKF